MPTTKIFPTSYTDLGYREQWTFHNNLHCRTIENNDDIFMIFKAHCHFLIPSP